MEIWSGSVKRYQLPDQEDLSKPNEERGHRPADPAASQRDGRAVTAVRSSSGLWASGSLTNRKPARPPQHLMVIASLKDDSTIMDFFSAVALQHMQ